MTVIRFIWYLVSPLLAPLAIIPLLIAWVILSLVCFLWNTWYRASGNPKYDPHLLDF